MARNEVVKVRLNKGEMRAVVKRSSEKGMGLSEYLRWVIRADAGYDEGLMILCPACKKGPMSVEVEYPVHARLFHKGG